MSIKALPTLRCAFTLRSWVGPAGCVGHRVGDGWPHFVHGFSGNRFQVQAVRVMPKLRGRESPICISRSAGGTRSIEQSVLKSTERARPFCSSHSNGRRNARLNHMVGASFASW